MSTLTPILLFTYKRLDTLQQTVSALRRNYLAGESELFVFSDGAKKEADRPAIEAVREFLSTISGFKKVSIVQATENMGLANSIINGVSQMIDAYGKVIVLEDDLITSPNFLNFMNDALQFYESNPSILSISGYSGFVRTSQNTDVYFTQRASSWGWALWKDRWEKVDWNVNDYNSFRTCRRDQKLFNRMGSDLSGMLERQMQGVIDSWAVRLVYHQFKFGLYSVHPNRSKIVNIGVGSVDATNTHSKKGRFSTELDNTNQSDFIFPNEIVLDKSVLRQFLKPYSFFQRAKYKILDLF